MDIYSFILSVSAFDPGTAFSYRIAIPKGQIGLFYILLPYINTLILDIILKLLLHIPYSLLFVGRLSVVAFIIGLYGSFRELFPFRLSYLSYPFGVFSAIYILSQSVTQFNMLWHKTSVITEVDIFF